MTTLSVGSDRTRNTPSQPDSGHFGPTRAPQASSRIHQSYWDPMRGLKGELGCVERNGTGGWGEGGGRAHLNKIPDPARSFAEDLGTDTVPVNSFSTRVLF